MLMVVFTSQPMKGGKVCGSIPFKYTDRHVPVTAEVPSTQKFWQAFAPYALGSATSIPGAMNMAG